MNRIDYIHPTAVEQIQKAMHGETVPSNDGNRDGMVNDVRYFSEYALSQIKGVDLGPEFDQDDKLKYKIIFTSVNLEGLDPEDPSTWKLNVLGIKQFNDNNYATVTLTEAQAKPMILGGIAVDATASKVLCFVVENMPDGLINEGDVITIADIMPLIPYGTKVRQYNSPMDVQSRVATVGDTNSKSIDQGVLDGAWYVGGQFKDFNLIVIDLSVTYSLALTWATLTANVPSVIQCMNSIWVEGNRYTIRVDAPFFTPTQE